MPEGEVRHPWPCARANSCRTASTNLPGPASPAVAWTFCCDQAPLPEGEYLAGPPVITASGLVVLAARSGILAVDGDGTFAWFTRTDGRPADPVVDEAGGFVTADSRGLVFLTAEGKSRRGKPCPFYGPPVLVLGAEGEIYAAGQFVIKPQVLGRVGAFDAKGGERWKVPCTGAAFGIAAFPDGTVWVKGQENCTWDRDEGTECLDGLYALSADGRVLESMQETGYVHRGDAWFGEGRSGDCHPMYDARGQRITGLGKSLRVGDRAYPMAGSGQLAVAPSGVIYGGTSRGLEARGRHGETLWVLEADGWAGNPVVDGEGRIYGIDRRGRILAASGEGRLLWAWETGEALRDLAGPCLGTGRTLYVAGDRRLIALRA